MIVEKAGGIPGILRVGPIVKKHRDGRQHLHLHPLPVAVVDALFGAPAVGLHFAEELVVYHHACAAVLMVVELDEPAIAKTLRPMGEFLRYDMGMNVDFPHRVADPGQANFSGDKYLLLIPKTHLK